MPHKQKATMGEKLELVSAYSKGELSVTDGDHDSAAGEFECLDERVTADLVDYCHEARYVVTLA